MDAPYPNVTTVKGRVAQLAHRFLGVILVLHCHKRKALRPAVAL